MTSIAPKRDQLHLTSLVAQMVKRLPAMRETWVQSLGREDPLEKEMATHSSILAWEIPWTEEPGGSMGWQSTIVILLLMILKMDHIFPLKKNGMLVRQQI